MQADQLFDAFIHICGQDSKPQALRLYIEQVLAQATKSMVYILYEPDITQRMLQPSICLVTEGNPIQAETVDINDLENPVSSSYVTGQAQQFSLHSRVTSSVAFQRVQNLFSARLQTYLAPLQVKGRHTPIAVLLMLSKNQIRETSLWQKQLQLMAILIRRLSETERDHVQQHDLKNQLKQNADTQWHQAHIEQIKKHFIGTDPASKKVQRGIVTASYNQLSVLIRGETGCGKDLVAAQIHQLSQTPGTPFIAVNCAALPAELIEAELFGCKKGAYTGSVEDRQGLVGAAQGGVLFLDEIGDMPYALQAVLLRVLNEKTYRRVGETLERQADFRLVCASNAPLEKMIAEGTFRKDLYYRICQLQLNVPPLRKHPEDLEQLAAHFIQLYGLETGQYHPPLSPQMARLLQQYAWPGNVRELKNFIFTFLVQRTPGEDSVASFTQFINDWKQHNPIASPSHDAATVDGLLDTTDLRQASKRFEQQMIVARLKQFRGDREKAAHSLGIPKRTLAYKCKKLQINSEAVAVT